MIFVCGAAVGSAVSTVYLHARMPGPRGIEAAQRIGPSLEQLKSALELTPEQEKTVIRELDDYAKYYQNIEDQREDVAEHGRQRILNVLTVEQKKKFNEMFGQPAQ